MKTTKTSVTAFEGHISQYFGENDNGSYLAGGLLGHTGTDEVVGYGTPIHAYFDMKVYKVLTKSSPANDGSGFTGVFGIVETLLETFEILYGHCDPTVEEGAIIKAGDIIGTEANHGEIYSGSTHITLAMQAAGDHRGSHRHIQKRLVRKMLTPTPGVLYLTHGFGYFTDGWYYEIVNYNNGYGGCVDVTKPIFTRDLRYIPLFGSRGFDVECLQRALHLEGFAEDYVPTAYYGQFTKRDVKRFQEKYGIEGTGYCGPLARAKLNDIYS